MRRAIWTAVAVVAIGSGCVSRTRYRDDVLGAYRKGLRVGRVIGRDEILGELKSPSCFTQSVNELMNQAPAEMAGSQGGKTK